ncbi:outer membrane beta-barrel protein [Marinoscillum sp.]|uniref:outer membrane beta-barrel protein n=1 Tax=Marinoscillum sp. TaxID=2024838 RepID=UPI003BA8F0CC
MKKLLITSLIVITAHFTLAQKSIGISYLGLGSNDAIHLTSLAGAASYSGESYYGVQLDYLAPINQVLSFETGIGYRHHELLQHPNVPPNMDTAPNDVNASILTIPVGVRVNFLKYLFINPGLILNADLGSSGNVSGQTGVGFNLGVGLQYEFASGLGVYVNPYTAMHSTLSLSSENYPERITESGLKIGVTFKIK